MDLDTPPITTTLPTRLMDIVVVCMLTTITHTRGRSTTIPASRLLHTHTLILPSLPASCRLRQRILSRTAMSTPSHNQWQRPRQQYLLLRRIPHTVGLEWTSRWRIVESPRNVVPTILGESNLPMRCLTTHFGAENGPASGICEPSTRSKTNATRDAGLWTLSTVS